MKRYTRKAPPAVTGRRRRKNYDDGDDFESLDFGPGDPHAAPDRAAQSPAAQNPPAKA